MRQVPYKLGDLQIGPWKIKAIGGYIQSSLTVRLYFQDKELEFKGIYHPSLSFKEFQRGIQRLLQESPPNPLLVVPFLAKEQLDELILKGISGMDLCGNVYLQTEGTFIHQFGHPNIFKGDKITQRFGGLNSLSLRAFFKNPNLHSLLEVWQAIGKTNISKSSVSQALGGLEQELILARGVGGPRKFVFADPERALDILLRDYKPPSVISNTLVYSPDPLKFLSKVPQWIRTGKSSAEFYGGPKYPLIQVYVPWPETTKFASRSSIPPNIELLEVRDPKLFYDASPKDKLASAVQIYLEMMQEDEEAQGFAQALRLGILTNLSSKIQDP